MSLLEWIVPAMIVVDEIEIANSRPGDYRSAVSYDGSEGHQHIGPNGEQRVCPLKIPANERRYEQLYDDPDCSWIIPRNRYSWYGLDESGKKRPPLSKCEMFGHTPKWIFGRTCRVCGGGATK
jgi:hypothetical protein